MSRMERLRINIARICRRAEWRRTALTKLYGQVNWAAPKTVIWAPPSGFIGGFALPARMVVVPEKVGTHAATPLGVTVAPGMIFPAQAPVFVPTHQTMSLLLRGCGIEELPNVPIAENGT